MDIRQITTAYFVAPQLDPSDMAALAEQGFQTVICNRPDVEIPASHHASTMQQAAEAAGLRFHVLELTHQTFTPENIALHRGFIDDTDGKVIAYCASGTRSTICWALGQADRMSADDIIAAGQAGGYQLDNMRQTLDALSAQSKD